MFTVAVFLVADIWKQPTYPQVMGKGNVFHLYSKVPFNQENDEIPSFKIEYGKGILHVSQE